MSTHLFLFFFFFPTCGTNFNILFNVILPSRSSRQLFTTISDNAQSETIFSVLVNPTQITPDIFPVFPPWSFFPYPFSPPNACMFWVLFSSVTSWLRLQASPWNSIIFFFKTLDFPLKTWMKYLSFLVMSQRRPWQVDCREALTVLSNTKKMGTRQKIFVQIYRTLVGVW